MDTGPPAPADMNGPSKATKCSSLPTRARAHLTDAFNGGQTRYNSKYQRGIRWFYSNLSTMTSHESTLKLKDAGPCGCGYRRGERRGLSSLDSWPRWIKMVSVDNFILSNLLFVSCYGLYLCSTVILICLILGSCEDQNGKESLQSNNWKILYSPNTWLSH